MPSQAETENYYQRENNKLREDIIALGIDKTRLRVKLEKRDKELQEALSEIILLTSHVRILQNKKLQPS